ncbi:MAG: hypothetical protein JWO86_6832 [Myxococcaceae bacterium]|nr:hypothetical protein [Myxococcaceae bacterium]
MSTLGVLRLEGAAAARLAASSRRALDRPLAHDGELLLATVEDEAVVLGALQRASELGAADDVARALLRRGSCGAEAMVGSGSLWVQLALSRADALVRCEPSRLLNRYVRPLLRALTKVGALAHYFDRDWISAGKRPVAMISFAHDAATGRALVEAVVAVRTPFAIRPRPSYLGKAPATLADIGAVVELARLGDAIAEAYASAYGRTIVEMPEIKAIQPQAPAEDLRAEPAWAAIRDEAIGVVGAGRDGTGRMRVGGELMASRDAVARLEERLAATDSTDPAEIGALVDASLGAPDVALVGVRSLTSLRDVIVEASRLPR